MTDKRRRADERSRLVPPPPGRAPTAVKGEAGEDEALAQTEKQLATPEDEVDRDAIDSFPASDPPAY